MTDVLLENLNNEQQQAVSAPANTNMLLLAGAGSGKTRVLVHRITWLIQRAGVSPYAILAVTFTNKAANEMRNRVESMLGMPISGMWLGTFHGLAHRLLRQHYEAAKLPEAFQILDSDDQIRLIRRLHHAMNLDEAKWPAKKTQAFIHQQKEAGTRASNLPKSTNPVAQTYAEVYKAYETYCQQNGLVDFAELLLRCYEVLMDNPEILAHYQQRFSHILVDEFQDTNKIQYAWLRLLADTKSHILAVGDDDQSIYSWRGAEVENMLRFDKDFPDVQTIRLEQNYRSTETILSAANAVISHNNGRLGKTLWTDSGKGEPITLYTCFSGLEEARFLVTEIKKWIHQGNCYRDIAILYRSNAQSRVLEENLARAGLPYRIYGGFKFFDRAEIKDALAYLRLITNRNDDAAFERVVNNPPRGIGNTTLDALRFHGRENQCSLWEAAKALTATLPKRSATAIQGFTALINALEETTKDLPLDQQMRHILRDSQLTEHLQQDKTEKGLSRLENLEELIGAMHQFMVEYHEEECDTSPTLAFLANVVLDAGSEEDTSDAPQDSVQLMTLHAAKGLEFPVVFLTGLEEGLFPHKMATVSTSNYDKANDRLEEERRLCYVGMTRAKKKLYITHAENRRLYGRDMAQRPSRFICEIPPEYIDEVRQQGIVHHQSAPSFSPNVSQGFSQKKSFSAQSTPTPAKEELGGFSLGQRVTHPKFGEGTILNYEGRSEFARIQIKFKQAGVKWLVLSYANLTPA